MSEMIKQNELSLSIRTRDVIFPVDSFELNKTLVKYGYQTQTPPRPPNIPQGVKVEPIGVIARKENNYVDINSDRNTLLITGQNTSSVVETFLEVLEIIQEHQSVNLARNVLFFEANAYYRFSTGKNPMAILGQTSSSPAAIVGKLLGFKLVPFGIHYCKEGSIVNSTDWFDIQIKPLLPNQTEKNYDVNVVLRNENKTLIMEFLRNIDENISQIIIALEENLK